MSGTVRVVHYLNQFFGQVGGEDKAETAPFFKEGPVGPGLLLRDLLKDDGDVIATIICGDNYFGDQLEIASKEILSLISRFKPDLVVAGPAFNSGRYGVACAKVSILTKKELGIEAITGMYTENPGVDLCKREVYVVETGPSALGMAEAMARMVRLGLKLAFKAPVGNPREEGYIPRGVKRNTISKDLASERAVCALLAKIKGEPFITEVKKPFFEEVEPAPPIDDLSNATIALVTEGGLIPKGNPDHIESHRATKYGRYSLEGLNSLDPEEFESIHRGYDTTFVNEDPNRLVPVDVMRDLEREGAIGKLYSYFYTTTGVATFVENSQKIGRAIANELKESGVTGVILTST